VPPGKRDHYFEILQKSGDNITRKGISSKRPTSISIIKINLLIGFKLPKEPIGPISLNPGPTLPIVAAVPTRLQRLSNVS
jgi:hypothetical protein